MTTIDRPPVGSFDDVPAWYEKPALPKGHVGFGMTPPRRVHSQHRSDPNRTDNVVEGRRTLAGVGTLVALVILVVVLLIGTLGLLANILG